MYLEVFLGDFAVFRGISWKYLNFTGPRPREISEALTLQEMYGEQLMVSSVEFFIHEKCIKQR